MQIQTPIIEENLKVKPNTKIAIIASRYNKEIVDNLIQGALEGLTRYGVSREHIDIFQVPGAFELPLMAQHIAHGYTGCVALGAVIRGDTPHFEFVSTQCAQGLMQVSLNTKKPIGFGVLTTNNIEQAQMRSDKNNNKGFEVALAVLEMIHILDEKNL